MWLGLSQSQVLGSSRLAKAKAWVKDPESDEPENVTPLISASVLCGPDIFFFFFLATSSESRALRAHIIFSSAPEAEESLSMGLTGQDRLRFPEELCFSVSCALNQSGKPVSGKPELYWPSTAVTHGHLKKKKKKNYE